MSSDAKPICGGGGADLEAYDLLLHAVAVPLVFFFSAAGCGFPVIAKRVKWMKIPPNIFFACKHFGTGVLIATAFVHLVPTAFASLSDPCLPDILTDKYPAMPGVIMMAALLALFVLEVALKAKTGGHSHGGPTGEKTLRIGEPEFGMAAQAPPMGVSIPPVYRPGTAISDDSFYPDEKALPYVSSESINYDIEDEYNRFGVHSDMPPWFQVFFAQYIHQREEFKSMLSNLTASQLSHTQYVHTSPPAPQSFFEDEESRPPMDPATFKRLSLNITLLEGGILFHSIFVGMTISITTDGFLILLIAILFHQFFEGLGLGSRIAEIPYPRRAARPWVLVAAFGLTCPIGQIIGLVTRSSYDPNSAFALILVGAFNAFSSGLLIYAATVDLLAEDFLSDEAMALMNKKKRLWALAFVFAGAAGMSVVGAFA